VFDTELTVLTVEAQAPDVPFRSTVAFDAATDIIVISDADGIISLTHTSTGSDRGVFAKEANVQTAAGSLSTSTTYAGTLMVEMWDEVYATEWGHAGYRLAGQATGAQTVTNTLPAARDYHGFGVISMTGVDQTTPVGTAAFANGNSTTPSVTVTGVGADDLVVDGLSFDGYAGGTLTVGALQTERFRELNAALLLAGSTQLGADGGVMSWSNTVAGIWGLGAVAFKPAAADTLFAQAVW
jgi:hypothetical protein